MLIESRHRRPRWLAAVLHRQAVDTEFFKDGLLLLLRVEPIVDVPGGWGAAEVPTTIKVIGLFDRPAGDTSDPDQLKIPMGPLKPTIPDL